jgi:hypothetical protein
MPWDYSIDRAENLGFVKASGTLTADDLTNGMKRAHQDPQFDPDLNVLLDYSEVTEWHVSTEFLRRVAGMRQLSAKSRTAIWITEPLTYGMGRIYEAWVEKGHVRIFTDRNEALRWLNEKP